MKDILNRDYNKNEYISSNFDNGVLTKGQQCYCDIFCNTNIALVKGGYHSIPFGNTFTTNVGGGASYLNSTLMTLYKTT